MENIYLIGDLARKTGLSIDTLNYYLRIGLIKEIGRSERNNYRYFNDDTVEQLNRIIDLRLKKVPIKEIIRRKKDGIL
ncbi:hypothetical protein DRQ09_10265 [candidate division KSB1 bacterium]|nr:MAG: hypothetical protein DRQ09_10265 [candidate division KSB1 bacterium]